MWYTQVRIYCVMYSTSVVLTFSWNIFFIFQYRAIKEGRDPDLSDYQDHKLTEDNVGYRMLKSMGWTEGMGLGAEGKGITTPVNQ